MGYAGRCFAASLAVVGALALLGSGCATTTVAGPTAGGGRLHAEGTPATAGQPAPEVLQLAPGQQERSAYLIEHELLGNIGSLNILVLRPDRSHAGFAGGRLYSSAQGGGSFLGLGREDHELAAEYDAPGKRPVHWYLTLKRGDRTTTDHAAQLQPGDVQMSRTRTGRPLEASHFSESGPVFEPLSALLFLRLQTFDETLVLPVLQGRNFWQVTVTPPRKTTLQTRNGPLATLAFDMVADPLTWTREKSEKRKPRNLTMWVTDDQVRSPVLLQADTDLGQLRVVMTEIVREHVLPALARR